MNLLVVTQYYRPETFRINDLVAALRSRGHSVTVLTGQPNYPGGRHYPGYGWWRPWREDDGGVRVLRCPLVPRGRGGGLRLAINYLSFALVASVLAPFRCRERFDAIFVYEPSPITVALPALVVKAVTGAPVVLWVLDLWPESVAAAGGVRSERVLGAIDRLVRFIYRHCDRVLVQSRAFIPRVQRQGVSDAQVGYFPSWADAVEPSAAPSLPVLPAGFKVMFTGNIGVAQDFGTILDAAERLAVHPDLHWIIVGDGRQADWVRAEVSRRGLERCFHLVGSFPVEAVPPLLAQADAALVTLKSDPIFALTIPAKIQTYLASGCALVGALDGEPARVVAESGAGRVGPAEDAQALADNVAALYRMSPAERSALGAAAREYYRREFERDHLMQRLESILAGAGAIRPPAPSTS